MERNRNKQILPLRGRKVEALEISLGQKLETVLLNLRKNKYSASEMQQYLCKTTGVSFEKRQLQRWLLALGAEFSREEAGRDRWGKGLMDDVPRKVKHSLVQSRITGSKVESMIRWELKKYLENKTDYEAVVGFTNWSILPRLEVDIPFVLIRKSDQRLFKFALEIDGERFHNNPDRWENKYNRLKMAGWHPLNVQVTEAMQKKYAWQIYQKKNISCLPSVIKLFTNIDAILNEIRVF